MDIKTTNLVLLVQFDETGKGIHGPDPGLGGRVRDQQLKSVNCVRHPVAQLRKCKLKCSYFIFLCLIKYALCLCSFSHAEL